VPLRAFHEDRFATLPATLYEFPPWGCDFQLKTIYQADQDCNAIAAGRAAKNQGAGLPVAVPLALAGKPL
jgi:hypothetical protein